MQRKFYAVLPLSKKPVPQSYHIFYIKSFDEHLWLLHHIKHTWLTLVKNEGVARCINIKCIRHSIPYAYNIVRVMYQWFCSNKCVWRKNRLWKNSKLSGTFYYVEVSSTHGTDHHTETDNKMTSRQHKAECINVLIFVFNNTIIPHPVALVKEIQHCFYQALLIWSHSSIRFWSTMESAHSTAQFDLFRS